MKRTGTITFIFSMLWWAQAFAADSPPVDSSPTPADGTTVVTDGGASGVPDTYDMPDTVDGVDGQPLTGGDDNTPGDDMGDRQPAGGQPNAKRWHSSDIGTRCEELTLSGDWSQYAGVSDPTQIWNFGRSADEQSTQDDSGSSSQNGGRSAQDFVECHAFMMLTEPSEYQEGGDQDRPGSSFSSFSGGGVDCLNRGTEREREECKQQVAAQGPTKCVHDGYETHDYKACKSMLQYTDGFYVGKQGLQTAQTLHSAGQQMDDQSAMQQAQASGNDLTNTTLNVQKNTYERGGAYAEQQAGLGGAKAATLMSKVQGFPTKEKMIAKCASNFTGHAYATIMSTMGEEPSGQSFDAQMVCAQAFAQSDVLLMNQQVADEMRAVATQEAVEAAANLARALMLGNMARQVDDTLEEIEKFEPPEFQEVEPPTISECLVDPTAEGCPQTTTPGYQGFAGQNFNSSIGAQNVENLGSPNFNSDDGVVSAAANSSGVVPDNFGSVPTRVNRDNSFIDGVVPPGSLKPANGGQGMMGGGGVGPGGMGAAPPGRAPANEPAEPTPSGVKSLKVKTTGDGMGVIGGRGAVGVKRKAKAKNPFDKLLGKKKKIKNGVMNFRALASDKAKSVLDMISGRYHDILKKNQRLDEYKRKEAQAP